MEIHKPKPWHGLREFLKEYLIVVVGVLTALGAEQIVEAAHWRDQTRETRETLRQEVGYDLKALALVDGQDHCIARRMAALDAWSEGLGPKPAGAARAPIYYNLQTSAWDVANSAQVIAHFPHEQRLAYARLYSRLMLEREVLDLERSAWAEITAIASMPRTRSQDFIDLERAVGRARAAQLRRDSNAHTLLRESSALAAPSPGPVITKGSVTDPSAFCDDAEPPPLG